MAQNEHIQRALYLLSLPRGPLLYCYRAFGREKMKHKLSGWLIEGSFSLLADLDSLRPICPVNFLFYRPRQRCLWSSEEKMNAQKAVYCDKMKELIVLGAGWFTFSTSGRGIKALLHWYFHKIIKWRELQLFISVANPLTVALNGFQHLGGDYILRLNNEDAFFGSASITLL